MDEVADKGAPGISVMTQGKRVSSGARNADASKPKIMEGATVVKPNEEQEKAMTYGLKPTNTDDTPSPLSDGTHAGASGLKEPEADATRETHMEQTLDSTTEVFLDRIYPNRHKDESVIKGKILCETRAIIWLRKGESITDFLASFRWIFRVCSGLYHFSLPLRVQMSRRRRNRARIR